MFFKILSAGTIGIEGYVVGVESDITKGIPGLTIVGLPNASVRESRERIRSAISNSLFKYPNKKIVVNLSPADIRKEGSHYDLPIAMSILRENYEIDDGVFESTAFLGELSLDGRLKPVKGCTALLLGLLKEERVRRVIIPKENAAEAFMVPRLEIIPVQSLREVYELLTDDLSEAETVKKFVPGEEVHEGDFSEVKGCMMMKRAAEIAASGFHNILMIGPPGSGKTMVASRMNSIMPSLSDEEYLEVSQIYSFLGEIPESIIRRKRPFRSPHHSITYTSLIGGGSNSLPGEVVLAHNGILFMDEFLEFDKKIAEGLRQPIEDKKVSISRVNQKLTYPSDFLLVISTNPCPCGNFQNPLKECTCPESRIRSYLQRASAPMLDRIDIFVETLPIPYEELVETGAEESSAAIRERVERTAEIQKERFRKEGIRCNSQMNSRQIDKYCNLSAEAKSLVKVAFSAAGLTARSYHRTLKVSRTIADMANSERVEVSHIAEALNFRRTFSKFWDKE